MWTIAFRKQAEEFNIPQAILGIVSRENRLEYIADMDTWTVTNKVVRGYIEKDIYYVEKIIDKTNKLGEDFNKWSEENLFKNNLSKLSDEKLISLLEGFSDRQIMMYVYGTVLPLIDFHNFSFAEGNLKKFLIEKVGEKRYSKYFQVFTEPLHNSFAQDQEEDLLKLMEKFYNKNWVDFIKNKNLKEIKKKYPEFYKRLQKHTEKHGWVYYVYMGPAFTDDNFIEFIIDYLDKGVNPTEKLREFSKKKEDTENLRKKYIAELRPNEFNKMILNLAGKMIWAKPRRKDYQSRSYYHSEKLLIEISNRLSISLDQIRSASLNMIKDGLRSHAIDVKKLNDIKKFHITLPKEDGSTLFLCGNEAESFYNRNIKKEETKTESNIKEIHGTTACRGKARGIVKIINEPSEMSKMNQGDILVSTATTPSIVPVMKKAAAIITNEGGLTCHAAIVSRELGTPCVIGTKIATKVLKDGDMVEVDADRGIVRIIK